MEINQKRAQFLLDAIYKKPLNATLGDVINGLKLDDDTKALVEELTSIANPVATTEEKPAETEPTA